MELVISNAPAPHAVTGRLRALKDLAGRIVADLRLHNPEHARELVRDAHLSPIAVGYVATVLHEMHAAPDSELLRILT